MLSTSPRSAPRGVGRLLRLGALVLALAGLARPGAAQARPQAAAGLFVTVRTLTSDEDKRIEENLREAIKRYKNVPRGEGDAPPFHVVFDFNPDGREVESRDFGAGYELAKFIRRLNQDGLDEVHVYTIAFVHKSVRRHVVLPVLACRDIVFSEDGKLGDVAVEDPVQRAAYDQVISSRPPPGRAAARKVLERDLRLWQVRRDGQTSPFYIDARLVSGQKDWPRGSAVVKVDDGPPVRVWPMKKESEDPADAQGFLSADVARKFGLSARTEPTRQEVARAYLMEPASLREDPLLGHTPRAWRIDVRGNLDRAAVDSLDRRIRRAVSKGANLIIFRLIDSGGGDFQAALDLAHRLRTLKDDRGEVPVTTVAYIPDRAPGTAAVLALGCSHIVMHKDAQIGGFEAFLDPDPQRNEQNTIRPLVALAHEQGYPELLVRGMLDRQVGVWSVVSTQGDREWRLMTPGEFDDKHWRLVEEVKKPGDEPLVLKADRARDLMLAHYVVEGNADDLAAVYNLYGVSAAEVKTARGDWLDDVAEFLRLGWVKLLLIMIGIICLILELKLPGATLPGILAAVCFILFFWAHSQLSGQFTWLAILLFLLGLILIALEIFVIPGFGVPGVSGILLVLISLALVTLERKPETTKEWLSFGTTLTTFGLGMIGAVVCALVLAWYLPHIPVVNRLILKPEHETEDGESPAPAVSPELAALLGAIGVAATPLRPAGKVQFGEEFVDVVADGGYVGPGARVQVIEIEGNRIVVKEV
jgi:membrane-bound ClpP family serine protease